MRRVCLHALSTLAAVSALALGGCGFRIPGSGVAPDATVDATSIDGGADAPLDAMPDMMIDAGPMCRDEVIAASKSYDPSVFTDDVLDLGTTPMSITLPIALVVSTGNAGNHCAELSFTAPSNQLVRCRYRGGADVAHVGMDLLQIAKGLTYQFDGCREGAACPAGNGTALPIIPGVATMAKQTVTLHIAHGDDDQGTTTASGTLSVCP